MLHTIHKQHVVNHWSIKSLPQSKWAQVLNVSSSSLLNLVIDLSFLRIISHFVFQTRQLGGIMTSWYSPLPFLLLFIILASITSNWLQLLSPLYFIYICTWHLITCVYIYLLVIYLYFWKCCKKVTRHQLAVEVSGVSHFIFI